MTLQRSVEWGWWGPGQREEAEQGLGLNMIESSILWARGDIVWIWGLERSHS